MTDDSQMWFAIQETLLGGEQLFAAVSAKASLAPPCLTRVCVCVFESWSIVVDFVTIGGADTINSSANCSSTAQGETFLNTALHVWYVLLST